MRRRLKRFFREAGFPESVALFMALCVILPTIAVQRHFTLIAVWEIILGALIYVSLRVAEEQ